MKIFRWLLSHIILILLVVAVIYGYMFWGNLVGDDTPAGKAIAYLSEEFVAVDDFVNAIKAKQSRSADAQPAESKAEAIVAAPNTSESSQDKASVATRDIEQNPVNISYSHNQMKVKQNSAGDVVVEAVAPDENSVSDTEKTVASNTVNNNESVSKNLPGKQLLNTAQLPAGKMTVSEMKQRNDTFVSPDIEKQLDNVDKHGKVVNVAQQSADIRASWIAARKSYYQRNYELSEKNYQHVIDNTEDNYDAYGELGNVYFNQGKGAEAASAYYEAAAILVRKGQVARARSLMGLLRHLDKSKADKLSKLIDSPSS